VQGRKKLGFVEIRAIIQGSETDPEEDEADEV
jgi:hypothetical protein